MFHLLFILAIFERFIQLGKHVKIAINSNINITPKKVRTSAFCSQEASDQATSQIEVINSKVTSADSPSVEVAQDILAENSGLSTDIIASNSGSSTDDRATKINILEMNVIELQRELKTQKSVLGSLLSQDSTLKSSCIKTIPSSEGDRETTRYRDLFSEVESEITLLKRKYEQLTNRVEGYESSQATKCCTCVSLQPELKTHSERIRRLEDNVLLLNNFIRNHSHTGTPTISDSKSCAPITHSHQPAPVQSHAGNTTSGHNGTPIPNHRAVHIPAANLSLTHKPNPNHSPKATDPQTCPALQPRA